LNVLERYSHIKGFCYMQSNTFNHIAFWREYNLNEWICNPGVDQLEQGPGFYPQGERYITDVVGSLAGEPGLEIWDVMNEPLVTAWVWSHGSGRSPDPERVRIIWDFVHHFCAVVKRVDPSTPITVGCFHSSTPTMAPSLSHGRWGLAEQPAWPTLEHVVDHVDVLAFHDYSPTRQAMREQIRGAIDSRAGEQAHPH
jgi:endo-1,4-beta-mannosidase